YQPRRRKNTETTKTEIRDADLSSARNLRVSVSLWLSSLRLRQFSFHQLARIVWEPMKSHSDAVSGIAVNNVAFNHDVFSRQRNPQCERLAHRDISLRAHVQAAHTYVFGAGHSGRIAAIKADIYNNSRTIV